GVRAQVTVVRALGRVLERRPDLRSRLRLAIIGDGALRQPCLEILAQAGRGHLAWLPGERDDVARLMQGFDVFVLPSLAEGISNTILEAMATGLPIVATQVGGNPELVDEGRTALLVPSAPPPPIATSLPSSSDHP